MVVSVKYFGDYVNPWPDNMPSKVDTLGATKDVNMRRETNTTEGVSCSSIYFDKVRDEQDIIFAEPIVWTNKYLTCLVQKNAPDTQMEIVILADDYESATYKLRLTAFPIFKENDTDRIGIAFIRKQRPHLFSFVFSEMTIQESPEGSRFYIGDGMHMKIQAIKD